MVTEEDRAKCRAEKRATLFSNIDAYCRQNNMSEVQLEAKAGLPRLAISGMRFREFEFRAVVIIRLAKAMDISADELVNGLRGFNVSTADCRAIREKIGCTVDSENALQACAAYVPYLDPCKAKNVLEHVLSYFGKDIQTCRKEAMENEDN